MKNLTTNNKESNDDCKNCTRNEVDKIRKDLEIITQINAEIEKKREEAEAASKAKTIFLANLSHEIRTPMNSIIGFSELAQDDYVSPKTKQYLDNIADNARWLLDILNDLLDTAKIESGKFVLENIPFKLNDIFSQCQSAILPKTDEKGLVLYCYTEPIDGKLLIGDPVRLRQVFMNLLSNAVKFTDTGTVKLMASINAYNEKRIKIKFEVKDSGIGMNPDQITNIFEPFIQADESVTRRFGGTGLGLPISKNIIEMMGGKLHVVSIPGTGSTFNFELVFDLIDDHFYTQDQETTFSDTEKPIFKGNILVCEDNTLNQQIICEHLARVGVNTVLAHDGKEAVEIVKKKDSKNPFDLIFMDIHMPVMDGLEAAKKITEAGVTTPIVALTANTMLNDTKSYTDNGMNDYIGKPFTSRELWKCLIKYLPVINYDNIDADRLLNEDDRLLKQLLTLFVKKNQSTFLNIIQSIDSGNIKKAYRIVHTLKSNAGQIGEKRLQKVATTVENMLVSGEDNTTEIQMKLLDKELDIVLKKYASLLKETGKKPDTVDAETALEIINRLESMLIMRNPECMNLLDEIKTIPGSEKLADLVEDFEFKDALDELMKIKSIL